MLISINWISDFVDLENIEPSDLLKRVTLSVCEVEKIQEIGRHWRHIRVAEIKSIRKHPEADKLNLVTFTYSDSGEADKEVVCGAPNVRVGMKIPYASLGVVLPNGMKLESKKIRGFLSEGMLCSRSELGIEGDASGLMELDADAPIGKTLLEYLGEREDILLDIDNKSLTHRPDLWGHYGMAREIAALYRKELKNPFTTIQFQGGEQNQNQKSPVTLKLEGESACLAYYGFSVDNVNVTESPRWMQARLLSVGLRPINNIVDISNYVMTELGIPNHIFDRGEIGNEIILKRVGEEMSFQTLDGINRVLLPSDTVVADKNGPLVIAGIMGGLKSGVTEKTKRLFVEVANWKYAEVRKTSSRLGLRSDSSQRYEKSLDSQLLIRTALRLRELILELCPGAKVCGKLESVGCEVTSPRAPLMITTSFKTIVERLGKAISEAEILSIFERLDFKVEIKVEKDNGTLHVKVPSYRATKDIEFEADLIEEIGRMICYDTITPVSPVTTLNAVRLSPHKLLQRRLQDFWVLEGRSLEVFNHPLTGKDWLEHCSWPNLNEKLVLANALSIDHDRMRPSLVPSLLEALVLNQKHQERFRFFEIGRVFGDAKNPEAMSEKNMLGVVFHERNGQSPFMQLVDSFERCLQWMKVSGDLLQDNPRISNFNLIMPPSWPGCHPTEFYHLQVMGKTVGGITSLHPLFLKQLKLKGDVAIGVLDLSLFDHKENRPKVTFKPLPKFPISIFDCTVVASEKTFVMDIVQLLKKQLKIKELQKVEVLTVFPLPQEEKKAVTLRSYFGSDDETLSGEFIKNAEQRVMSVLDAGGFPLR